MTRASRGASLTVAFAVALAIGGPRAARGDDITGVVFVAQPVRGPVAIDRVSPVEPFVPADTPEGAGPIAIGPDRAAAIWLEPLDVIRVLHDRKLAIARVVGGATTRARIAERGAAIVKGVTYLAQPPGRGDVWIVWSEAATTVRFERPVARDGRLVWDATQRDVLAWIDRGGTADQAPAIPITEAAHDVAVGLRADSELGAAIEATAPSTARAVRAWRKASAVAMITAIRPLVAPQLAVTPIDDVPGGSGALTIEDPRTIDPRPYTRVVKPQPFTRTFDGPGVLRVEARAVLPAIETARGQLEPPQIAIAIAADGRKVARRSVSAVYATTPDPVVPPPAFPTKRPLRAREGDYLGERVVVSLALLPGRHSYTIELEGGPLAVRAATARRRIRVGEALAGRDDVDSLLSEAREAIANQQSDAADLVRRLVHDPAAKKGPPPTSLAPRLALAWWAFGDPRAPLATADQQAAIAAARAAPGATDVWWSALALARSLANPDTTRELFRAIRGTPPASMVPELAGLLPRATPLERIRNWTLAALDGAWRAEPLDPIVGDALRAAWWAGDWATVPPAMRDPDIEPPPAIRWLVENKPRPGVPPRAWRPGDLVRLSPKQPRDITVIGSAVDATRSGLIDVYLATPADDSGPHQITVDQKQFHAFALAPIERVQIGAPPGAHRVAIGAAGSPTAKQVRGWVSQLPSGTVPLEDTARIHSYWPIAVDGARVQYALPAPGSTTPVEVSLRVPTATAATGLRVSIHADVGDPIELVIAAGAPDPAAHPLDATRANTSEEVNAVVRVQPQAKIVWFEASQPAGIVAAVATRRERTAPPPPASERTTAATDLIERVARASRALASDPEDAKQRAQRASDLLDLGEIGLAREDLLRLVAVPASRRDAAIGGAEEELFARLDNFAEPTHVAVVEPIREPIAVAPGALALATNDLAKLRPAAALLRSGDPARALSLLDGQNDPSALALAARAYAASGDDDRAARALIDSYVRSGHWQVGLEAIDALYRAIADRKRAPASGRIAITYGIAQRLREAVDHPRLRRALVVAAAQSGWDTITATTTSAGQEHLLSTAPTLPPAPPVLIREAMLAPPWPTASAHTLTAGAAAVLDLTAAQPTQLRARVRCARLRSGLQPADAPCSFTVRVDNGAARAASVAVDQLGEIAIEPLAVGHHVVEVTLPAAAEGDAASLQFVSDRAISGLTSAPDSEGRHPIKIERRGKVFVASAGQPITTTVNGPTMLWVQGRALQPDGGERSLEVVATPKRGDPVRTKVRLPGDRDASARGDTRELVVGMPVDQFIILPDSGPYQVAVRPDRGASVMRLALRDERRGKFPRLPGPWYAAAPITPPPFAMAVGPALASIGGTSFAPDTPGALGTLSLEVAASQDARPDEDALTDRVYGRIDTAVNFRRELVQQRVWVLARGVVRNREDTALIAGASGELYLDRLPVGTTLHVSGNALTQAFSAGRAYHAHGDLRLLRRFPVGESFTVIPTLGVALDYLNTTPEIANVAAMNGEQIDPDVYNDYRYLHDRSAIARLALRWTPFQDVVAVVAGTAVSNRDLASLDVVGASAAVRALLPLPLLGETLVEASYRPSYRFADADRMLAYWRHDVGGRIDWTLWAGTEGRLVVSLWDDLLLASQGDRNALGLGLRFDLVRHRGLVDFSPDETGFTSLLERRSYAPIEVRR